MNTAPQRPLRKDKAFTVFTLGDSSDIATWSNVPFFFTRALERYGFKVVRVNIRQNRFLQAGYDLFWNTLRILRITRTRHNYFRSPINYWLTNLTIERALRRYPRHHNLFMTYSFGANKRKRDYTLFCDMTFEKSIEYFEGRPADRLELRTIHSEEKNLEQAKLVISLFPELAEELREEYGHKVKYYGNVVNIEAPEVDEKELLHKGEKGIELVFIGKEHYKTGLKLLLRALPVLNERRAKPVHLHVIGLNRGNIRGPVPANVTFHGYLDKGNEEQRKLYYDILKRAYLFVNPNVKWGAFSASLEAMFLYTPVVLFPYAEFTRTFGEDGRVGHFLQRESATELAEALQKLILDRKLWRSKALHAHDAVKHFTWDTYVGRYLTDLSLLRTASTLEPIPEEAQANA